MNFETPTEERTELTDWQHQPLSAELAQAWVILGLGNLLEPIEKFQLQDDGQLKRKTQNAASLLELRAAGAVM